MSASPTLLGLGDNSVDLYADLGVAYAGGNCVNVAVMARAAGIATAYLGAVGDDRAGATMLEALRIQGVETVRCRILPGETAWSRVRLVGRERRFEGHHPGPSPTLLLDADDIAYARGFSLVHASVFGGADAALAAIRSGGPLIAYDLADKPVDRLPPDVDIAFLSRGPARHGDHDALAVSLLGRGLREVVITHGAGGATSFAADGAVGVPAQPVEIVDTLGAGDALIARCLVGILRGEPRAARLAAGIEAASAVCRRLGAFGEPIAI